MQYPKKIQIGFQEGTCPLRCKKCPGFGKYAKQIKESQKMSMKMAEKIIDEIACMEVLPIIQPHLITEPFANRDLMELIPYCCDKGLSFSIITNGILLDKVWMNFLIEQLDRNSTISFSLDAVTQETYEKVRGNYSLAELEKKIEYMLDHRCNQGPRIGVNFVYEEDNYSEKDIFFKKWKDKVDVVHIGVCLDEKGKVPKKFKKGDLIRKGDVCPFLQEVMAIDANGEVRVCSRDAFGESCLGNVFEEGVLSVWNGIKRKELLHEHKCSLLKQEEFCYDCEWGDSLYYFDDVEETEKFIIKRADYAMYYNRK